MKLLLILSFIFLNCCLCNGQDIEKLMREYSTEKSTTKKTDLFFKYYSSTRDSIPEMIIGLVKVLNLFKKNKDLTGIAIVNLVISDKYSAIGDYTNCLRYGIASLKNFEDAKDSLGIMRSLFLIGNSLVFTKNFEQALVYLKRAIASSKNTGGITYADNLNTAAYCMIMLKKPDSAFAYVKPAISIG